MTTRRAWRRTALSPSRESPPLPPMPKSAPAYTSVTSPSSRELTPACSERRYSSPSIGIDDLASPAQEPALHYRMKLPLIIGETGEIHTLRICIHPDWAIRGTTSTIHLHNQKSSSDGNTHDGVEILNVNYDIVDLWGASLAHHGIQQPHCAMVQPRLRTRWTIVLKTIAIILLPLLFGFLLRYVVDNIPSHPAWVTESLEITPLSIPLANPISYIYREWTEAFLPLLIQIPLPFEHNGQASVAYLDGMLYQEIEDVHMGLHLWNSSQVPGPDPSVLGFFEDAEKAASQDLGDHPEKFGYRLLQGQWVLWFVVSFVKSPTTEEKIEQCALLWNKVRKMNLEALENLKKLDERYSWLDTAGAALLQVRQEWELPSPHHDHWWYPFLAKNPTMLDMLDSINFTVTRLIPWIQPNRLLVTQAIKKLEHLNDVIEAEKKKWDTADAGGGVVVDDVLSPGSTRWIWNTKRVIKSWDGLEEWELMAMMDEWEASYNRVEADDLERPRYPRWTRPSEQPKEKRKWWWWFYD